MKDLLVNSGCLLCISSLLGWVCQQEGSNSQWRHVLPCVICCCFSIFHFLYFCILNLLACSAMDSLAQSLMKDAVNCDKHSDLQNSANQLDVECGLRFWVSPESRSPSSFDNSAWSGTLCCKQAKAVDFGWHAITFLALWMLLQICWVFDRRCNYLSSCMCILPLPGATSFVSRQTWCEINRPAEFKHISKQRTANWKGFLQ